MRFSYIPLKMLLERISSFFLLSLTNSHFMVKIRDFLYWNRSRYRMKKKKRWNVATDVETEATFESSDWRKSTNGTRNLVTTLVFDFPFSSLSTFRWNSVWAQHSMAQNVDSFSLHFIQRCCCCCFLLFVGRPFVCSNRRTCMCTRLPNGRITSTQSHISNMQPTHMVLSISVGSENEKRHICVVIIKIMNHSVWFLFHRRHIRIHSICTWYICLFSHFVALTSFSLRSLLYGLWLFYKSYFVGACFWAVIHHSLSILLVVLSSLSLFLSFELRVPHGFVIISSQIT